MDPETNLRKDATTQSLFPSDAVLAAQDQIAHWRSLTLQQRGELIVSACRTAALIRENRLRAGLPDVVRVPWPQSTVEFFRKYAPNARR